MLHFNAVEASGDIGIETLKAHNSTAQRGQWMGDDSDTTCRLDCGDRNLWRW